MQDDVSPLIRQMKRTIPEAGGRAANTEPIMVKFRGIA